MTKATSASAAALTIRFGPDLPARQRWLLAATVPVALPGLWHMGTLINPSAGALQALLSGLYAWTPLLLVLLLTAWAWTRLFARLRGTSPDSGWLLAAVLCALILPASTPLPGAVMALSFGLVLGSLVFGGSRRHPLNPALLAAVAIHTSLPELHLDATPGTAGVLASVAAALLLARVGVLSWQQPAGVVLGTSLTMLLLAGGDGIQLAAVGIFDQLAFGHLAFAAVFLLCDPATTPLTRPARWATGIVAGSLAVTIRLLDPAHPEGTFHAMLLAVLAGPLFDRAVVAWHGRRRGQPTP